MAVKPVVLFGDPRLTIPAVPVDFERDDWRDDARDLAETLSDLKARLGYGRALAGPQIGSRFRLVAVDCSLGSFVAVNPQITWLSEELVPIWDDCFSLPGVAMAVMRHASVSFRYRDLSGQSHSFEALEPSLAELVQHEVDHLDGVLMVDRLVAPKAIIARELASTTPHPNAA